MVEPELQKYFTNFPIYFQRKSLFILRGGVLPHPTLHGEFWMACTTISGTGN